MSTHTFEIHSLDGKIWVRPYAGNEEFNGETFDTMTEARDALPAIAVDLGWDDYNVTGG